MPEISRFFGISIRMYFDDHIPPHFHAIYAGAEAQIGIEPLTVLRGRFPRRALGMALEWADIAADGSRDERHGSFIIQANSTATGNIQDTTTGHVISRPVVQPVRFLATDVSSGDWF